MKIIQLFSCKDCSGKKILVNCWENMVVYIYLERERDAAAAAAADSLNKQ